MKENLPGDDGTAATADPWRRTLLQASLALGALAFGSATNPGAQASTVPSNRFDPPPANEAVSAFRAAIPTDAIEDLKRRLAMTRWPEQETVNDGSQGVQLARALPTS